MKFGGGKFAQSMWAGAEGSRRPPFGAVLGFASGFPPDWLQKMLAALPEDERDDEIALLVSLGLIP